MASTTSSTPFTITPSAGTPTITGFSPTIGAAGTTVTITGTNFETVLSNNKVAFNTTRTLLSSATTSSIVTTVPPGTTSGRISVTTPLGKAVSSGDFFIPPAPYTAADVEFTGRMGIGESKTITINTANKIALILFDGTQGQRVSLGTSGVTISSGDVSIFGPDGRALTSPVYFSPYSGFVDTQTLPANGTYMILVDPQSTYTGNMTLTLYNVPPDVTGSVTVGGPAVAVTINTSGQNARLTFSGTQGQRLSLGMSGVTIPSSYVSILSPEGTTLGFPTYVSTSGGLIDPKTLPVSGMYTILVDPLNANTGSTSLTLYNVPPDITGTIAIGGPSATVTITAAGQNALLTFTGTAEQGASLAMTGVTIGPSTCCSTLVQINKPDGTYLASTYVGTNGGDLDTQLPVTGTYTILIDPQSTNTGSVTLTLSQDVIGTITIGGPSVPAIITRPGQNARLTFTGTAGQAVSLGMSGVTIGPSTCCSTFVQINKPDGTYLASTYVGTDGGDIDTQLPVAGPYTVLIDPQNLATGGMTLTLSQDVVGAITIGGPAVPVTISRAGQNARLVFTSATSQTVNLNMTNVTIGTSTFCSVDVYIDKPDGTYLTSRCVGTSGGSFNTQLPGPGTYIIRLDPRNLATGSMTLALAQTASLNLAQAEGDVNVVAPTSDTAPSSPPQESRSIVLVSSTVNQPTPDYQSLSDEAWLPDAKSRQSGWVSGRLDTPWQSLLPLQAEDVTALAGQVLTLNGEPLANVTLRLEYTTTQTDETGRFLLGPIPAGHHELIIDGRTASTTDSTYGLFEVGVDIAASQTNVLPYTIWMPKLDLDNAVTIPSPTTTEVVVTTPHIPGLEVRIPPGTIITDSDGQVVTQLSITPIPVDRPPFPLPRGVIVPIYYTIQPGGAYVYPPGARIIYPNYTNEAPGTRINFWHYDPEEKGWYVYGQGTVTEDGRQVVPDPGVAVYEFTGAMINVPGYTPPPNGPPPGSCNLDGDPVDLSTGLFVFNQTDLVLPGLLPIALTHTYRPEDDETRPFGIGTTHPYEMSLWSEEQYQEADLILPDGGRVHYVRISPGTGFEDAEFESTSTPTVFYKSRIKWNGNGWDLTLHDGTVYVFGDIAPLNTIRDRYGNTITIARAEVNVFGSPTGNITQIKASDGRWIEFTYDSSNRVIQARDNIGRVVTYTYDTSGRLWKVTDPTGGVMEYSYDASHRMLTVKNARGIVYLTNQYDSASRVIKQTHVDGGTYQFAYTVASNNKIAQTDMTDPRGNIRRMTFNAEGYCLADTHALGKPEQQTFTYERQAGSNLILSMTDPLGRKTAYTYDAKGNVISITRLAGTAGAVKVISTYEPTFNQVATITDPLNHTTTFTYDSRGNLTKVTDPLSRQTNLAYNPVGQPISITDPLGNKVQFTYDLGDLAAMTDPLNRTATQFIDSAGRLVSLTNPLGHTTRYEYDALNRLTRLTDPLGGMTSFGYDPNGNLLSITDARDNVTRYSYDSLDRLISRTDPLERVESYQYDAAGNLVQFTDRKGQTTRYQYDGISRLVKVTYADGSTISYTYDKGDRLTQTVDSLSGTITRAYDNLDRLTTETTPQGAVNYTYDAAGRRTSMTVAGQQTVNYSYDNANRSTQITQGTATVTISYDNADRRTTLTLPNGVVINYAYDAASQTTGITYKRGVTILGNLTYQYDAIGQPTQTGGSFARTSLPQPVASTAYDAANQLTHWGATTLVYDANGNLTNDGIRTYQWNVRNQLISLQGGIEPNPAPAPTVTPGPNKIYLPIIFNSNTTGPVGDVTFQYDAFGRRIKKTIQSVSTEYLYDGVNPVQERSGGTPTATMLTGLGVDEYFTRTDAAGTQTFLTDALGSTVALVDSAGAIQTQYTYESFGKTTIIGATNSNPFQYTGRENDRTGLYYYRARYYSPTLYRFISTDPIGFAGGINLYQYTASNPLKFIDPYGYKFDLAKCLAAIAELFITATEIVIKYADLLRDPHNLFINHRYKTNPHPKWGSYEGHQEQLRNLQRNLEKLLDKVAKACSKDPDDCDDDEYPDDLIQRANEIGQGAINLPIPQAPIGRSVPFPLPYTVPGGIP